MDPQLQPIAEKVDAGARLTPDEGLALLRSGELWTVGELADRVRQRLHGRRAYYNVNRHVNYSNVCALSCKFCSFYRKRGDEGAYEQSIEEVVAQAREADQAGATELHIVGGLHPWFPFSYYTDMLRALREAVPGMHLKAFTAVEIVHLAKISKRPRDLEGVLRDLMDAGLNSLPGGGAEVFDDRVHDEAFKGKIRSDKWLEVHRTAHRLGLRSNATILYGHLESLEDRIEHLRKLREAQDEALAAEGEGQFQTVIPLPFIPEGSELEHLPGPTGLENLKMLAVSRLMLDNFPHVKAFWVMQSMELSQLALSHGVDDIDGTVVWYDITKLDGADTHQEVSVAELQRFIREAGYEPMERDTLYRPVERDGASWRVASMAV
jgi:aminodeoxyfutalosine synthase